MKQLVIDFEQHQETRTERLISIGMERVANGVQFKHITLPDEIITGCSEGVFNSMVKLLTTKLNKLNK